MQQQQQPPSPPRQEEPKAPQRKPRLTAHIPHDPQVITLTHERRMQDFMKDGPKLISTLGVQESKAGPINPPRRKRISSVSAQTRRASNVLAGVSNYLFWLLYSHYL